MFVVCLKMEPGEAICDSDAAGWLRMTGPTCGQHGAQVAQGGGVERQAARNSGAWLSSRGGVYTGGDRGFRLEVNDDEHGYVA